MLQNFNLGQTERVLVIRNWLGRVGLQPKATLTQEEQEAYNDEKGCLNNKIKKFKPEYNKTIKSVQFCKLIR